MSLWQLIHMSKLEKPLVFCGYIALAMEDKGAK